MMRCDSTSTMSRRATLGKSSVAPRATSGDYHPIGWSRFGPIVWSAPSSGQPRRVDSIGRVSVGSGCMGHMHAEPISPPPPPGVEQGFRLTVPPMPIPSDIALDADQRAVLDHSVSKDRGSPLLVLGAPGTGKTTALLAAASAVAERTNLSRVLVLTHSRPAAQQLRSELVRRTGRGQLAVKAMTVHGFCRSLLQRFGDSDLFPHGVRLLTGPEQEFRVRELLAGRELSGWPTDLGWAAGTAGFAREVRTLLATARRQGMDPADMVAVGEAAGRDDWVAVGEFFTDYLDVLDAEGVLDYAELVHRSRLLLTEAPVRAAIGRELDAVLCDEYAELDAAQIQMLVDLASAGPQLMAFADPWTSVFGFRGADPRAVADFGDRFAGLGGATTLQLRTNHRNPPELVSSMASVIKRLPHPPGSFHPAAFGQPSRDVAVASSNPVRVSVFDSPGAQFAAVAELLRRVHLDDGVQFSEMAVITRNGRSEVSTWARQLSAAEVPVVVAGDEVALAEEVVVRPLLVALQMCLCLVAGSPLPVDQAEQLLRSGLGGLDAVQLRRLGRSLRMLTPEKSSAELLARALEGNVQATDESPDAERLLALSTLLNATAKSIGRGVSSHEALWSLWNGTDWPHRLRRDALSGGHSARRAHRDLDAVVALFDVASRATDQGGVTGVRALLADIAAQQIPADTSRESSLDRAGVRVLTAHRAKGLQWRLVVVVAVQESHWPSLRRPTTLLDADRLGVTGQQEPTTLAELLAEERRLFLLAMSRATERLVVTAVRGTEGEAEQPSRFLTDLDLPVESGRRPAGGASTLTGVVAELRRVAGDVTADQELRQQAASRLARLASARDGQGHPMVPAADPTTWWAGEDYTHAGSTMFPDANPITLSGSSVESLVSCPRQWFCSRQLRADSRRSPAAALGSMIHALICHASSRGTHLDDLRCALDEVWERVPFEARWLSSSERLEVEASLERFWQWQRSRAHQLVAAEVDFTVPIRLRQREVLLRGTVDRLELDSAGRLLIVDFKTTRRVVTQREVDSSIQMGIYQLAARQGAFDHLLDEPSAGPRELAGAELVYLRRNVGAKPWPKVLRQPPLDDQAWVHEQLEVAVELMRAEHFPAVAGPGCTWCSFAVGCPALGKEQAGVS